MKKGKVSVLAAVIILVLATGIFYNARSQENDMEHVINTALRIQYGWGSTHNLKKICTEDFIETTDIDDVYLGRRIYSVDKDYVENVQEISENKVIVSVHVYSPDILIHQFTLEKVGDDQYLISKIEHDI